MSQEYMVELCGVDKVFKTRHFFQRHEETGKRHLYRKKRVHAVDNVTFGVRQGEIFGLLGRNGAGKTTTVKMVSGLVKPGGGQVIVDGLEVEKNRLKVLRKLGVVLEGTRTSIWPLTPMENLKYFGNLRDVKGSLLRERSEKLMDFIGMRDKMNTEVRKLSRGQKQKVAVCIALITDPDVLLLDEPTTGLDVQTSRTIKDRVIEMTREQGKSVIVTTHDMNVAQELCDRIGIIEKGKLVACKPTDELLDIFSDQAYEIRTDALPDIEGLKTIPGVQGAMPLGNGEDPGIELRLDKDEELRSKALYETMDRLRNEGRVLRGVNQRQQTLENVFLELTSEDSA
jgi:ABC-2 type transport system ATP-binding protein